MSEMESVSSNRRHQVPRRGTRLPPRRPQLVSVRHAKRLTPRRHHAAGGAAPRRPQLASVVALKTQPRGLEAVRGRAWLSCVTETESSKAAALF